MAQKPNVHLSICLGKKICQLSLVESKIWHVLPEDIGADEKAVNGPNFNIHFPCMNEDMNGQGLNFVTIILGETDIKV